MKGDEAAAQIVKRIDDAIQAKMLMRESCVPTIARIAELLTEALKAGNRVYIFGNGGSAADAQHIAGELEGRYYKDRRALPVLALTTNTSTLTAIGNDFGYEMTFKRQVDAHVRRGDVVIAISTSGNAKNVIEAVGLACERGATVVGFTGRTGGKLAKIVDVCFHAPSDETPRIQECHITAGHIICELVEAAFE